MSLEQNVMTALKEAMKAKDQGALRALRAIKSEILLFQTSGAHADLDDAAEIKLLQKMIKQRKDSLDIYEKENRQDLAAKEIEEIEVIEQFLPKQLSDEELKGVIDGIIQSTGASSIKDMGKVMGMVSKQVAGKAEGARIAAMVKSLLGG
ncbi:MAG TPA: GatB/YqeY domain-containing protein [Saprospiraceae bacterium]|nr:GatB/YqeY domain-containing protein [Lewinellaceae bacterium]HPG06033.1 GatB/YqeY domain-containing protein [Saprospiraceae bacterium]HPR02018.1 GatB/YqeY domain-containing protein [Saprospiraceae bacterium]HQU53087.1 GatB/YqeY domain-containing protein [Saprospiraceae bacterium]HRV83562.1 GatB/YqeY domain-containing protein [Saprospiraceae bacterium]